MEHLYSVWSEIATRIETAGHIVLFSDFDGTLAPIVDTPDLAILPERTRQLLHTLKCQPRITVAIVSGRALDDIKSKVGIDGVTYVGNHGLEIEGPEVNLVNPLAEETRPILHRLHGILSLALAKFTGVIIEDKGLTLSVHYRLVEDIQANKLKPILGEIIDSVRPTGEIRITSGKKVYEVRPVVAWDKGEAIDLIVDRLNRAKGKGKALPIFLGDDVTDDDGFITIGKLGGISVFVGDAGHDTAALYFLRSPTEVDQFLSWLVDHAQKRCR